MVGEQERKRKRTQKIAIALVGILLLISCCCVGGIMFSDEDKTMSTPTPSSVPTLTPIPELTETMRPSPESPTSISTVAPTNTLAPVVVPTARPVQVRCGAICKDGTQSNATGRGACSGHDGVDRWLYCDQ